MIKIGKICLLTEGEIFELNKKLGELKTKIDEAKTGVIKSFHHHDRQDVKIENVKRCADDNSARIKRMADIIMPTLPIAKRKALAKLFDGPKKAAADKQTNANVNASTESK